MDLKLKGSKALITGGTKGIGRAIANVLADEGCNVAICARNAEEVDAAVADLSAKGVTAFGQAVDIGDGDAFKAWISASAEALGGIDCIVSNVSGGGAQGEPVERPRQRRAPGGQALVAPQRGSEGHPEGGRRNRIEQQHREEDDASSEACDGGEGRGEQRGGSEDDEVGGLHPRRRRLSGPGCCVARSSRAGSERPRRWGGAALPR